MLLKQAFTGLAQLSGASCVFAQAQRCANHAYGYLTLAHSSSVQHLPRSTYQLRHCALQRTAITGTLDLSPEASAAMNKFQDLATVLNGSSVSISDWEAFEDVFYELSGAVATANVSVLQSTLRTLDAISLSKAALRSLTRRSSETEILQALTRQGKDVTAGNITLRVPVDGLKGKLGAQDDRIAAQDNVIAAQNNKIDAQNHKIAAQSEAIMIMQSRINEWVGSQTSILLEQLAYQVIVQISMVFLDKPPHIAKRMSIREVFGHLSPNKAAQVQALLDLYGNAANTIEKLKQHRQGAAHPDYTRIDNVPHAVTKEMLLAAANVEYCDEEGLLANVHCLVNLLVELRSQLPPGANLFVCTANPYTPEGRQRMVEHSLTN